MRVDCEAALPTYSNAAAPSEQRAAHTSSINTARRPVQEWYASSDVGLGSAQRAAQRLSAPNALARAEGRAADLAALA